VVNDLLLRWEEQPALTPEVLCREYAGRDEHAALLEAVRRGIRELQAAARFLAPSPETGDPAQSTRRKQTSTADPPWAGDVPARALAVPEVPGYEILGELGRGGMGVVYKARHQALNRLVALKMVLSGVCASPEGLARFQSEARAIARLQHPHIVQIHEIGEHNGLPFFALEFCPGGSLDKKIKGSPLLPQDGAQLVATLARAMHAAHERQVIHRDLKPANVLLAEDGTPKVSDFGLAKLLDAGEKTQTGAVLGTPSYMAPEQTSGRSQEVGSAADVYALGAILYELLTGRPPFKAATAIDTLALVRNEEPIPPSRFHPRLPRDLETICLKCLEKSPADRYPTAAALADDLRRWMRGEVIQARPAGTGERVVKWVLRHPTAAALAFMSVLAAIVAVAGIVSLLDRSRLQQANAVAEEQRDLADAQRIEAETQKTAAEQARHEAEEQRRHAETQKAAAEQARHEVEVQRDLGRRYIYASNTQLADRAWNEGDVRRMRELLEGQRPEQTGGEDLRGFEWYYLWRLLHAQLVELPFSNVGDVVYSPDGRLLTGPLPDGRVGLCEAETGRLVRPPWNAHDGVVRGVAFSPDGRRLATSGEDRAVRVWDVATGRRLLQAAGLPDTVHSLSFSADGQLLAGAGPANNSTIRVWDAESGDEWSVMAGKVSGTSVSFSPVNRHLAVTRVGEVDIWDVDSGQRKHFKKIYASGWNSLVAFSPDGGQLAVARPGAIQTWDLKTDRDGSSIGTAEEVLSLAYSPDGRRLAYRERGGSVTIRDAQTVGYMLSWHVSPYSSPGLMFSPDGQRLVAGGIGTSQSMIWDATTNHEGLVAWLSSYGKQSIAFSPDGEHLAVASERQWGVMVIQAVTGMQIGSLATRSIGSHVAYSPDGRLLAATGPQGSVQLWDARSRQSIKILHQHTRPITGLAFSPNSGLLAVGSEDGTAKLWDVASGTVRTVLPVDERVLSVLSARAVGCMGLPLTQGPFLVAFALSSGDTSGFHASVCVAFSPDGSLLATGSGATVHVWDVATLKKVASLSDEAGQVQMVAFGPNGRLATAGGDGIVRLWDVKTGLKSFAMPGHEGKSDFITFSPDGRRLASGGVDGTIRIWDVVSGQETLTLRKAHRSNVYGLAFSPDGRRLASGGGDGTVRVWEAQEAQLQSESPRREMPRERWRAWQRQEAETCERSVQWFAAAFHLGWMIEEVPNDAALYVRRARARAESSLRKETGEDLAKLLALRTANLGLWRQGALLFLRIEDAEGYRRCCEEILTRVDPGRNPGLLNIAVRACTAGPNAVADPARIVALAQRVPLSRPGDCTPLHAQAAALYRAGQFQEAAARAQQAVQAHGQGGSRWDWLLLAMAHHCLGHLEEARQWFAKAPDPASLSRPDLPVLEEWLEFLSLRREAEALLKGPPVRSDP
jgi:WD40 repeat protein/tRNA A-37 threonylcarbamoyl transferase component Bud32